MAKQVFYSEFQENRCKGHEKYFYIFESSLNITMNALLWIFVKKILNFSRLQEICETNDRELIKRVFVKSVYFYDRLNQTGEINECFCVDSFHLHREIVGLRRLDIEQKCRERPGLV